MTSTTCKFISKMSRWSSKIYGFKKGTWNCISVVGQIHHITVHCGCVCTTPEPQGTKSNSASVLCMNRLGSFSFALHVVPGDTAEFPLLRTPAKKEWGSTLRENPQRHSEQWATFATHGPHTLDCHGSHSTPPRDTSQRTLKANKQANTHHLPKQVRGIIPPTMLFKTCPILF